MNTRSLLIGGAIVAVLIVVTLYRYGATQESSTLAQRKVDIQNVASQFPQQDSRVVSLDTQQRCDDGARSFFGRWKSDGSLSNDWAQAMMGSGGMPSYASHYNATLGKCFIRIGGIEYNNIDADGSYYRMVFIYDVYESRLVAYINIPSRQDAGIMLCEFPGNEFPGDQSACKNEDSFKRAVASYMEN
jgi:hypothetical protein